MKKEHLYKKNIIKILPMFFVFFLALFYFTSGYESKIDAVYISMSIFLFATVTGFFISIQGNRYLSIVKGITDFDGNISFIYRSISAFGEDAQEKTKIIIKKHYKTILDLRDWDAYLAHKNSTITDLNYLINKVSSKTKVNASQGAFTARAYFAIGEMQKIRKNLIVLYRSRIPSIQWYILDFLAVVVIMTVMTLPTYHIFYAILVKALFSTAVVSVLILIRKVNNLNLFEDVVGRSSAEDVLNIMKGKV